MIKAILKSYALDANSFARSRIITHSNTASFLIKITLHEIYNIPFRKNYWKFGKMNASFWKNIYVTFCMEKRSCNIFKATNVTKLNKAILKNVYEFCKRLPASFPA